MREIGYSVYSVHGSDAGSQIMKVPTNPTVTLPDPNPNIVGGTRIK